MFCIQKVLELATDEDDFVLDSFLGSGTTAAVAHKMKRKYIGIELGRKNFVTHEIDDKLERYFNLSTKCYNFKTVNGKFFELTVLRICLILFTASFNFSSTSS